MTLVSCIANKIKFDWSGLDEELFRNLTCIPSVCMLISERFYAKRDQPYKAMVFRHPSIAKYNADASITFRILRHLYIGNTTVKLQLIYDT